MGALNINRLLLSFIICMMMQSECMSQNSEVMKEKKSAENQVSAQDEKDIKTTSDPIIFAKNYAKAWCSQNPDSVALYYVEDGSLSINNGKPSVGRTAIAKDARAFMNTFPHDMVVTFDKLVETPNGLEFHWTLTGTNSEPHGTGKKVNISGFELWQLDNKGLIKESKGNFDANEYNRQLIYGSDN